MDRIESWNLYKILSYLGKDKIFIVELLSENWRSKLKLNLSGLKKLAGKYANKLETYSDLKKLIHVQQTFENWFIPHQFHLDIVLEGTISC